MYPSPKPAWFSHLTPQRALAVLRQPSAIAVFASIAVHGVLAVTLPLLPMKSEEPKQPRAVKVVTLTPEEQRRIGLGNVGGNVGLGNGSGNGNGLRSANALPDLSSLPPSYPTTPSPDPFYSFPPAAPPVDPIETTPVEQTRSNPTSNNATPSNPGPKPSGSPTGNPQSGSGATNPMTAVLVCPSPPDSSPACKKKEQAEKEKLYIYDPTNTSEGDGIKNLADFTVALSTISGNKSSKDRGTPQIVSLPYSEEDRRYIPKAQQVERIVGIAVIIQPDGKLAEAPRIIVSSGHKPLDDRAISYVTSKIKNPDSDEFKPSKDGTYKGVIVNFRFMPEMADAPKP